MMAQMMTEILLDWMWGTLGLYWLLSARRTERSLTHEATRWRVIRLSILAVTFLLLLSPYFRMGWLGRRFIPDNHLARPVGVTVTAIGIILSVWARVHLGKYWSDKIVLKVDHQLVQSGPYAFLRHPIYSGVLLGIAGTALAVGEWRGVLALLVMSVNYCLKARREEKILAARFGADFTAYQQRAGFLAPKW